MTALSLDAKILDKNNKGTITWIILDTLVRSKDNIYIWKNEARPIGWVGDHGLVREALERVQTVVRLMLETMGLEFHDDLFPQWWEAWDLYGWQGIIPGSATDGRLWSKFDKL